MRVRRHVPLAVLAAALVFGAILPLGAYLKLGTEVGGRIVPIKWTRQPIRYFVTNRAVTGVGAADLQAAIARAFGTWGAAPRASIAAEFAGFVSSEPFVEDGASVIGFRSRADLEDTLGATTFSVDTITGELIEADIFLNSVFPWSVSQAGQGSRFDVDSIVLHEVGHLLGLGHSAIGETDLVNGEDRRVIAKGAVMFPIAYPPGSIQDRVLQPDDQAGIGELYGGTSFMRDLGSISGRVTRNGAGLFGAHVTAFSPATGETIGSFSLDDDGMFVISGLAAGVYIVRAEPLDDADADSFFDPETIVDVNFRPTYFEQIVAVPSGGTSRPIEVKVQPR